jgi:hypothetical protein
MAYRKKVVAKAKRKNAGGVRQSASKSKHSSGTLFRTCLGILQVFNNISGAPLNMDERTRGY